MRSRINGTQINFDLNYGVALGCHLLGFGLILAACLEQLEVTWAVLGLALIVVGAVRNVAGWLWQMEVREKAAYELGHEAGVRSIR